MTLSASARRSAPAALLVAATVLFSGCASASTASSGDDVDAATRTIDDYFGPVEIPADPQRIVAGDTGTLGNLFALGITPVGAAANANSLPHHLADRMDGVVDVRGGDDINWEKVLAQKPDLFITFAGSADDPWNKEEYDAAAAALPTFGYAYDYVYLEDIKKNFTEVARAVGKDEEATQRLAALDERLAELKERVTAAGLDDKPVSVLRVSEDGNYSIRVGTSESIAFRALGIAQPEGQTDPEQFRIDISEENLNLLDSADTLFVYVDDTAVGEQEKIESSPLWQTLPAVQADRVHFVSSGVWNSADIIGFEHVLDDIETFFIEPGEQK